MEGLRSPAFADTFSHGYLNTIYGFIYFIFLHRNPNLSLEDAKWIEKAEFIAKSYTHLPKVFETYKIREEEINKKKNILTEIDTKITQDGKTGKKLMNTVNHFTDYLFG